MQANPGSSSVRIGLTDRALDDIGEVEAIENVAAINTHVAAYTDLVRIDWEAMSISDGDELYHTKWANVEGAHTLRSPIAGTLLEFNDAALRTSRLGGLLEADDWLVEMAIEGDESLAHLVGEDEYMAAQQGAGRFGSSDESLKYTSYG